MTTGEQLSRLPEFERERALALHGICRAVAENIAAGMRVCSALEQAARDNHRRRLKAGTRKEEQLWKELKLSLGNFKTLYIKWQESPSAIIFLRQWKPGRDSLPPETIQEFRRRCTGEGQTVTSVAIQRVIDVMDETKILWCAGTADELKKLASKAVELLQTITQRKIVLGEPL